jgi:hypothetical protein
MSQNQDTILTALMEQLIAEGPDGMAQVFTALFNHALRLERERFLGAGLYERNAERRGYANGYKSKTLDTTAGTVTVDAQSRWSRRALLSAVAGARAPILACGDAGNRRDVVQGVSTRDAAKVMAEFAAGRASRRLPQWAAADTPASPQGLAARSRAANGLPDPDGGPWLRYQRRRWKPSEQWREGSLQQRSRRPAKPCGFAALLGRTHPRRPQPHRAHSQIDLLKEEKKNSNSGSASGKER